MRYLKMTQNKTPIKDLKRDALKHYNNLSDMALEYDSFVADAIKAYNPEGGCSNCDDLIEAMEQVIAYPEEGSPRRTDDGYPSEFAYDRFAYERVVDSLRNALREIIKEYGTDRK
jgi:hypothetical protein